MFLLPHGLRCVGGPAYREVSAKHHNDPAARRRLAEKILHGGSGVWGKKVMPSNPQHNIDEALQMADWILGLHGDRNEQVLAGTEGVFQAPADPNDPRSYGGVLVVGAAYTDDGYREAPPARARASHVLHARRRAVAYFDELNSVDSVEVFEGAEGNVAASRPVGHAVLRDVNLFGINAVTVRAWSHAGAELDLRAGSPEGRWWLNAPIAAQPEGTPVFRQVSAPLADPGGCTTSSWSPEAGRALKAMWPTSPGSSSTARPAPNTAR